MTAGKQFMTTSFRNGGRRAGIGTLHDDYSEGSGNKCYEARRPLVRFPHDGCKPEDLNGPASLSRKAGIKMANEKLIRASDARRAILQADPRLAYCIDSVPGVDAVEVVRCKDCKHYAPIEGGKPLCEWYTIAVAYDDFCSYGERKDNG